MGLRRWRGRVAVVLAAGAMAAACRPSGVPAEAPPADVRQLAYLKASNGEAGDHFGCGGSLPGHIGNAVAISSDGNTVAVGAPHESSAARGVAGNQDDNSRYNSGAVYVFVRRGDGWVQQAYLKASNAGRSDLFALTLSLSRDGHTLAVAAPWESSASTGVNGDANDDSIPQAGAVYVFTRAGEGWTQEAYLKASNTGRKGVGDDVEGDQFGFSLALSGDGRTLAVGAIGEDSAATGVGGAQADDSAGASGAVYVFTKSSSGWMQQAYVKSGNSEAGDLFGYGVGLSDDGDALAVAAYDEDGSGRGVDPVNDNGSAGTGAIYAFDRKGGVWVQSGYLKGSRSQRNDALGYTVAMSGDGSTIAAGTADESCLVGGINPAGCDSDAFPADLAAGSVGAVYVWTRTRGVWAEQAFIKSAHPDLEDWFGVRLALSGDGSALLVGAPMEDGAARGIGGSEEDDSAVDSGAAYLFGRNGTVWSPRGYLKASNADPFDEFGSAVAISGDGRTMIVGARMENGAARGVDGAESDNGAGQAGAAYLFGR